MRVFFSELAQAHDQLTFGYTVYAERQPEDQIDDLYTAGFLPYSGSPDGRNLFYMARSARLHLPTFELDSECRRVAKKFDGVFSRKVVPISEFPLDTEFLNFWLEYYERMHGPTVMPAARLEFVLGAGIATDIGIYTDMNGVLAGYTLEVHGENMVHVWYTSYATELAHKSFGMWLLLDIARAAREESKSYFYAGTAYGKATDYKANFPNLEYWNGEEWVGDAKNRKLRERARTDEQREFRGLDEWKERNQTFFEKPYPQSSETGDTTNSPS